MTTDSAKQWADALFDVACTVLLLIWVTAVVVVPAVANAWSRFKGGRDGK